MSWLFRKLFPWLFLILGVLILKAGIREAIQARASGGWPVAIGKIAESGLRKVETQESDRSTKSTTWHAEVRYLYEVGGRQYSSTKIGYGDYGTSKTNHAQEIIDRYPVDAEVRVHYMAADPKTAVLEPGASPSAYAVAGFGAFVFGIGIWMLRVFNNPNVVWENGRGYRRF